MPSNSGMLREWSELSTGSLLVMRDIFHHFQISENGNHIGAKS